jgi:hypothetical protein
MRHNSQVKTKQLLTQRAQLMRAYPLARRRRIELPPFAESYLGSHRNARHVVRQFHLWLKGTHRPLRLTS